MSQKVQIRLEPLGEVLDVKPGTPLKDVLFTHGVEFPCGGKGKCKGCRVRVVEGELPVTRAESQVLKPEELEKGWRLSCLAKAEGNLTIDLAQWENTILADDSVFEFKPRQGYGVAVDLGTTTVVGQLLNLSTGQVLAVRTALNMQALHGADIMSRIGFAVADKGQKQLEHTIRTQIGQIIMELLAVARITGEDLRNVVIVGNTVMHHIFCGIDLTPLSYYPFEPEDDGHKIFKGREVDWPFAPEVRIDFLPCLGGFVGSDILAGILATKLHLSEKPLALVDLGTNGEMVFGNKDRMVTASTAAGPAFEGARISQGMRASTGAISEVTIEDGKLKCHVLGNVPPRGLCGSGLVDAVAHALELGLILPGGRLADKAPDMLLMEPVKLTQTDIRELQLAKGAIAAGLRILILEWGSRPEDVSCLYLAGAFGNYINRASARRIGLLDYPREIVRPSGNTALLGAKMALFEGDAIEAACDSIRKKTRHVSLHESPQFQDIYVEEMTFHGKL